MGLEEIVKKISSDGNKSVTEIEKETASLLKSVEKETEAQLSLRKKDFEEKVKKDIQEIRNRRLSDTRVQIKKKLLLAQREVIDSVFKKALQEIIALPDEKYLDYLLAKIDSLKLAGAYTIILNAQDRKRIGKKLVEKVAETTKGRITLALSDKVKDIAGGFIIKGEETEMNASLDVAISQLRREIEPELAALLFTETSE